MREKTKSEDAETNNDEEQKNKYTIKARHARVMRWSARGLTHHPAIVRIAKAHIVIYIDALLMHAEKTQFQ